MDNAINSVSASGSSSSSSSSNKTSTTDDAKAEILTNAINEETEAELIEQTKIKLMKLNKLIEAGLIEQTKIKLINYFIESSMRLEGVSADQLVIIYKSIILGILKWVPPCHFSKVQEVIDYSSKVQEVFAVGTEDKKVCMGSNLNPNNNALTKEDYDAVKTLFKTVGDACISLKESFESIDENQNKDEDTDKDKDQGKKVKNKEIIDQITTLMKCLLGDKLGNYAKKIEESLSLETTLDPSDVSALCQIG